MKMLFRLLFGLFLAFVLVLAVLYGYGRYEAYRLDQSEPLQELIAQEMSSPGYVTLDEISPYLQEATIAVEDDQFYTHPGVDPISLIRALISQIVPFIPNSGGSTITQQVVKNLYQKYNGGWSWKLTEIAMAFKLESLLNKDQILALYMNIINYGDGYQGIEQASYGYFEIAPSELDLAQSALLAGIPQSPNNLQLSNHFYFAKLKQKVVLKAMVRNDMISQQTMDEVYAQPVEYVAYDMWQVLDPGSQALAY